MCSQNCKTRVIASSCLSVHLSTRNSAPDRRIFYEIWQSCIFWKSAKKIQISLKSFRIMDTSHEDVCTVHSWQYLTQFFSECETFHTNVADEIKTDILCSITFFWKLCHSWDNVEKYGTSREVTDDNITRRMYTACSITQATDPHSENVILIAFPHQQWLHEWASKLCLYVHCLPCLTEVLNWQKMHCLEQT